MSQDKRSKAEGVIRELYGMYVERYGDVETGEVSIDYEKVDQFYGFVGYTLGLGWFLEDIDVHSTSDFMEVLQNYSKNSCA